MRCSSTFEDIELGKCLPLLLVPPLGFFNIPVDQIDNERDDYQGQKSEQHEMPEPIREGKRHAAEHIPDTQEKQGPDERCNKLDAHEMTKGNFEKSQYNER